METKFVPEFYHTYNRGVEKRKIFLDNQDFFRAAHDLYEFNDKKGIINLGKRIKKTGNPISINKNRKEELIDIVAWCFMPNHYHIFSKEKQLNSLSKFQQKFGIGFANYFNLKNGREGTLFQSKYKKVHVTNDAQAAHLICYIHTNLLDLWKLNWKEKGLSSSEIQRALEFLADRRNRWSSHQDYWGIENFSSLINKKFLNEFFGGIKDYRKFFIDWLKQYENNVKIIKEIIIE